MGRSQKLNALLESMGGDFENSNFEKSNLSDVEVQGSREANGVIKMYGQVGSPDTITGLITGSKGDLNLTVKRNSINIEAPLPFVLFGLNDFQAKYVSTLKGFLPSGVTVTVASDADGNVVFTYTSGLDVDTITVSFSGANNYTSFLQAMNQNYFKTKYMLVSISDEAQRLAAFSQTLNYGVLSALGAKAANQLMLRSRIMTWDFQKDRVNVLMPEQKVTADFGFVMNMIAVDEFTMGFDVYMSDRVNLNQI